MIYTNDIIKQKNAKKRKIKKIINAIYVLLITITLLAVAYICYIKFIKKENNIKFLGVRQYVIMTGSMEPNYNIGDIIIDKEIEKEDIKIGDVITYSVGDGKHTISHRIIKIVEENGETLYQTKGDNNNAPDSELVSYNQIQGKAIYKIDKIGLILKGVTTGAGIAVIVLISLVWYLSSSRKQEKMIEREEARKKYNFPKYKSKKEENNG